MHKKILSYILIAAITMGSFNINTLKVRANEISAVEETGNSNLGTGDLEIEIPEMDRLEVENPEVELPGGEGSEIENEEVPQDKEEDEQIPEDEEVPTEEIVEDMIPEEVPEEKNVTKEKENLDELAEKYRAELPDGIYYIRTALSDKKVLSVKGGAVGNKVNVVIRTCENADEQRWKVTHDAKGYITFTNIKSGKVLDVSNGVNNVDKTVWQYSPNNTLAQKWIARKEGNDYEIVSAVNGMVLNVKGGSPSDNTGIQIYASNDTKAQRFQMISATPEIERCDKVIPEGAYRLIPKNKQGYAVDIENSSFMDKANVQLNQLNDNLSQIFNVEYVDGYYTFTNKYSCKALDVELGGFMPTTNVWQYLYNSSKAQKWTVEKNEDGSYSFISVHNGMVLGIDGMNVQVQNPEETEVQDFILEEADSHVLDQMAQEKREEIPDGIYYMRTALKSTSVVQIQKESTANGAKAVIHQYDKDSSQQWKVTHDEKGYVTFTNMKSGKVLDVSNGGRNAEKVVWQYTGNGSLAQKWIVEREGSNYRILSALNGMAFDVRGGSNADNTRLQIYASKNVPAQQFQMISTNPVVEKCEEIIQSGYYYICAKGNPSYAFDIQSGSEANGANVQIYKANNTFAQAFDIRYEDGYYTIRNMYSNKMLDVASGGYMPTTNVWQYKENGTKAQKWAVKKHADGSYSFISVHNGMALDVATGKIKSGSNVQVYTPNGSEAQKFVLKEAESFYEGFYNIRSVSNSSFIMEIVGGSIANKTNIQLYKNNKTESQKWIAIKNEDGTFRFMNSKSGKALDIANGNMKQGNGVWAYPFNGTEAQKWIVEKLEDNTWRIVSAKNKDYVLAFAGDIATNKSKVVIQKWNDLSNQKWTFGKVNVAKRLLRVEIAEGKEHVINKGANYQLQGKEIYTNGTGKSLIWKRSNNNVVSVSSTGQIKGLRHGSAVITAISKTDKSLLAKIRIYVKETKGQLTKAKLDSMNLGKIKKLMIVAHPEDETFWGGGHLLQDDWLVVCITNARNKKRSKEFFQAMQYSEDKAIILDYADINDENSRDNWKYGEKAIREDISLLVKYKKWDQITVHNPQGEYGHIHHIMLSKYTSEICKEKGVFNKLYYFGKFYKKIPESLKSNLSKSIVDKKRKMVNMYPSQVEDYNKYWKSMEAHEHWIKASNW